MRLQAHNLKVVGSNPTPATKFLCAIKCLYAALRGGVYVSEARGSTVEGFVAQRLKGIHLVNPAW